MNLDLGSPAIEIAIGLAFVFFLLSVVVSALSEFVAGVVNLRASTLREGIEGMLGDAEIAEKVLGHPLLRTDLTKGRPRRRLTWGEKVRLSLRGRWRKFERDPSYISSTNFARAFLKVIGDRERPPAASDEAIDEMPVAEQRLHMLWKQLDAIGFKRESTWFQSEAAWVQTEAKKLEKWFDDSMDRVSGWYKRRSQIFTIVIAFIVAFGLNASTLSIVQAFETDPGLRAIVVKKAEEVAASGEAVATGEETATEAKAREEKEATMTSKEKEEAVTAKEEAAKTKAASGVEEIKMAGKTSEKAFDELKGLKLPIFWGAQNLPAATFAAIAAWFAGILITVIAISLGAPFWFDTLGKLSNLRMAGKKPEEPAAKPA